MITDSRVCDFSFNTVKGIQFGAGCRRLLAELIISLGASKPLLITDAQLKSLGLVDETQSLLIGAGLTVDVYTNVTSDPTDQQVIDATEFALSRECDLVVGFGGGSPMDVAKLVAVLASSKNLNIQLSGMYGVNQFSSGRLPLIQVPTTAGTGSEVTPVAIVTTGNTTKAGVVNSALYADKVVLDPELTLGLPSDATAATGIDAMVHAIEAYTSKILKNPMSDSLAIQALELMSKNISIAVNRGEDVNARGNMLYAAMLAGQAFANAPVGGVHALAYPLGGLFHVAHGLSNSLVLPHVLRFNSASADREYSKLASVILCQEISTGGGELLADYFIKLSMGFGLPTTLREVGVKDTDLSKLAEQAMLQERLLINNPKEISKENAFEIYSQAY